MSVVAKITIDFGGDSRKVNVQEVMRLIKKWKRDIPCGEFNVRVAEERLIAGATLRMEEES